jgi:putative phosphoribosyl transferase
MKFEDRKHAGVFLAPKLFKYREDNPLVLALPRGGVPVAAEVADRLEVPWNVLIVRKIGAPFQPELAVGALCENEEPYLSESSLAYSGLNPKDLDRVIKVEREKIQAQIQRFRNGKPIENVKGRTIIVVDDGLATGATVHAAIKYLRKKGAGKVVVAVPVAAASSANQVRDEADEVVDIEEPEDLYAISPWYQDFSQVSDEEVLSLLHPPPVRMPLHREDIVIEDRDCILKGNLTTVPQMKGLILFAHGSGSGRLSPRNQMVAQELNSAGFGTLLFDLLTLDESEDRQKVFDIPLLSRRLVLATQQLRKRADLHEVPYGYFGASTGAGAALLAAAQMAQEKDLPFAVVSRGGRPDLAGPALKKVESPTLLIVGAKDSVVIPLNEEAQKQLEDSRLILVPDATHLFEEDGALEEVAHLAAEWFLGHCPERFAPKSFGRVPKKRSPRAERGRTHSP